MKKTQETNSDKKIDFNLEGEKLLKSLNIDKNSDKLYAYSSMHPVWKEPNKEGMIYIGSEDGAQDLKKLKANNITHVVNCTDTIPNYHDKVFQYYRFDISDLVYKVWREYNEDQTHAAISPLFTFIDSALENGGSVLLHCLAGAHRAGTTGILSVMHYANFDQKTATSHVKKCRSMVEPIGNLPEILKVYEKSRKLFTKRF